jgi:hypothetical protein
MTGPSLTAQILASTANPHSTDYPLMFFSLALGAVLIGWVVYMYVKKRRR